MNRGEQDVHCPKSPVSFVTENGSGSHLGELTFYVVQFLGAGSGVWAEFVYGAGYELTPDPVWRRLTTR